MKIAIFKVANNKMDESMKSLMLVLMLLLPFIGVEASENKAYEIPRTEVIPIKNSATGWQYELYIKLPEGYDKNSDVKHPVIYIADAVWHIEILSATTEFLMENAILVGISWQKDINEKLLQEDGAHVSRYRDYTVSKSSNPERQAKHQSGNAAQHLTFIRNDVIKFVENNYRTDPSNRTYFGYSLSGLFGASILMAQPDTFKNYIIGSPSLWRSNPYFAKLGAGAAVKRKGFNANVFISYGSKEQKLGKHINEFISLLKNRNDNSLSLTHEVVEGSHQTGFPMAGLRSVTWLSNLTKAQE